MTFDFDFGANFNGSSSGSFEAMFMALESASTNTKTFGTISKTFDRVCGHVVFDAKMAQRMISYQIGFVNKNEDHIAFFGGVLTGVHVVRMTSTDMSNFFSDVLQINEIELEDELHELQAIVADRKVSGDVFNHSCLWAVHKFLASNLPKEVAVRAALAAALVLQYRFLTSLLAWYFKFQANPAEAQAAYSRLTKKSAIKQYGSWHALLEARCMDLLPATKDSASGKDGLHYKTVLEYQDDNAIVYALNDSQGRIRSMMKHLMAELIAAKTAGSRVRETSSTVELDGEGFLRDRTNSLSTYVSYLNRIVSDEHTFIKQEIITIIAEAHNTAPPSQLHEALKWMSANYKTSRGKVIDPFLEELMVHCFRHLSDNRTVTRNTNDIASMIMHLKGLYMSSRSTDPQLLRVRDMAEEITRKSISSRSNSVIAAVRTALMLYVVTRAFTMQHYAKG